MLIAQITDPHITRPETLLRNIPFTHTAQIGDWRGSIKSTRVSCGSAEAH